MEFKKINEDKFQCLLYEEDLEYNNITLDDFFRNDTEKIHNLLDVIMDEAHKNIGVDLGGGVMSLQLAPQPDHSILLTVSSGKEDFGNMLKQAGETGAINFTGNIEARDVPLGGADVVVADGFSGNILLKGIEGTALFMASMMKNMFKKNVLTKLAALLCMDGVKAFKKKMDYRETGGTALIGLSKPVIKAHGSSDALAIRNAIRQAIGAVEADVAATLAANMDHMVIPKEYQHAE